MFSQLLIPTMDSTRSEFIITKMAKLPEKKNELRKENNITSTLIVGGPGTAKTSTILMYLSKLNPDSQSSKRINFSSATLPENFQDSINGEITKQNSKTFKPHGGKQLTIFIDDFSMPAVNTWGDQITLEITRQLMD
jgi:dynein heavy chain, axonemal